MTGIIDALYRRILLDAHPVGSVYITFDGVSPETLFGGVWEEIAQGCTIIQSGEAYPAGSTGGEAVVTLAESNLPPKAMVLETSTADRGWCAGKYTNTYEITTGDSITKYANASSYGSNEPHNNMPPYIAAHIWRRTA